MLRRDLPVLAIFALMVAIVAAFGALFGPGNDPSWYALLRKPSFNPPNWVFAPVWTLLYALMAVAAWLVWRRRNQAMTKTALIAWGVQLVLNAAWTPVFFGAHAVGLALTIIAALLVAIIWAMVAFRRLSLLAVGLLVPYLAWVFFATTLNASIWILNR